MGVEPEGKSEIVIEEEEQERGSGMERKGSTDTPSSYIIMIKYTPYGVEGDLIARK